MFEDYPRALAITPDRWRRGVFTPPVPSAGRSAVRTRSACKVTP
jgi:hypothetical protein